MLNSERRVQVVQTEEQAQSLRTAAEAQSFLARVAAVFKAKPFKPHPAFKSGNAQTLAAYAWPQRKLLRRSLQDEQRLFEIEPDVKVLGHCRWHKDRRRHATVVIWHGMEGSTNSVYMIRTAEKAFRAGLNVVRVNFRNCGGTEHLTPTLYHGGLSSDLRVVLNQLIENDGLDRIFVLGFSLGGNMVLKLAGEYGEDAPSEIVAVAVVSPSVDLHASAELILSRRNWLYHKQFLLSLKTRIRLKQKHFPELYDLSQLTGIRNIREFDQEFTALAAGFKNVDDYYLRASSLRVIQNIRIPTLIIHAEDDPFIPFGPLRDPAFYENPYILLIATERGGHVAFISARQINEDRFWAENRVVEFFQLANEDKPATNHL
jgi:predicted alpha/beta-fold hydrolase